MQRHKLVEIIGNTMNTADREWQEKRQGGNDSDLADFFLFTYGKVADAVAAAFGVKLEPDLPEEKSHV